MANISTLTVGSTKYNIKDSSGTYLPKSGGAMTGNITRTVTSGVSYIQGCTSAALYLNKTASASIWFPAVALRTYGGGGWALGNYTNENLQFVYGSKANIDANTNTTKSIDFYSDGGANFPGTIKQNGTAVSLSGHTHDFITNQGRLTNPDALHGDGKLRSVIASASMTTNKPLFGGKGATAAAADGQIIDLPWDNNGGYDAQIAVQNNGSALSIRGGTGKNSDGTQKWTDWAPVAMASAAISNITRSGTTFTATRANGTTFTFTQQDSNTTYTFTNKAATLAWNTTSTIATVGGTDITVKMPANPNTNTTYSAGSGLSLSSTTFSMASSTGVFVGTATPPDYAAIWIQ